MKIIWNIKKNRNESEILYNMRVVITELKDCITIITAIIGAVLGVVNLVMNIQNRLKENIKIYNDRFDIKYKLSGTETYYEDFFIKIPLNINYYFYVLL